MDLHFLDANSNHFVVPDAPEGYTRVDATAIAPPPSPEHRWIGGEWRPPEPIPPSTTEVDAERDHRIANGFTFNGVRFQSRPEDRENIAGAALAALKAMVNGKGEGELDWFPGVPAFAWIAEDNSTVAMDAPTMFAFGEAAAAHKQALIFKARAIKDMDPIPADFADDSYWT